MHIVGMHGHPRRIADPYVYQFLNNPAIIGMNQFMTYSAFGLGLTQLIFAFNFFYSLVAGPKARRQPLAREHAGVGHDRRRRRTTTSRRSRPSTTPAYEYSVPGRRRPTTCPRPSPGRRRPARSTRSWPDA